MTQLTSMYLTMLIWLESIVYWLALHLQRRIESKSKSLPLPFASLQLTIAAEYLETFRCKDSQHLALASLINSLVRSTSSYLEVRGYSLMRLSMEHPQGAQVLTFTLCQNESIQNCPESPQEKVRARRVQTKAKEAPGARHEAPGTICERARTTCNWWLGPLWSMGRRC